MACLNDCSAASEKTVIWGSHTGGGGQVREFGVFFCEGTDRLLGTGREGACHAPSGALDLRLDAADTSVACLTISRSPSSPGTAWDWILR
jgi:hypothetical protein